MTTGNRQSLSPLPVVRERGRGEGARHGRLLESKFHFLSDPIRRIGPRLFPSPHIIHSYLYVSRGRRGSFSRRPITSGPVSPRSLIPHLSSFRRSPSAFHLRTAPPLAVFSSNVAGQEKFLHRFFSAATVVLSMLCGDGSRPLRDTLSSNMTERIRTPSTQPTIHKHFTLSHMAVCVSFRGDLFFFAVVPPSASVTSVCSTTLVFFSDCERSQARMALR
jgi:hypothetical protein